MAHLRRCYLAFRGLPMRVGAGGGWIGFGLGLRSRRGRPDFRRLGSNVCFWRLGRGRVTARRLRDGGIFLFVCGLVCFNCSD